MSVIADDSVSQAAELKSWRRSSRRKQRMHLYRKLWSVCRIMLWSWTSRLLLWAQLMTASGALTSCSETQRWPVSDFTELSLHVRSVWAADARLAPQPPRSDPDWARLTWRPSVCLTVWSPCRRWERTWAETCRRSESWSIRLASRRRRWVCVTWLSE